MSFANFSNYKLAVANPTQSITLMKAAVSGTAGKLSSSWTTAGGNWAAGAAPSTAVAPTKNTIGSLVYVNKNLNSLRLLSSSIGSGGPGTLILCDRLSHQGGLNGTLTTTQTTNLPTAPLTRFTSGEGVWAAVEIYTTVGTTATTATINYTNQSNIPDQTSDVFVFGGTGYRVANQLIPIPLINGDTGIRRVDSFTAVATTGTAGNFGITLFKPLVSIPIDGSVPFNGDALLGFANNLNVIPDDACLFWVFMLQGTSSSLCSVTHNFGE